MSNAATASAQALRNAFYRDADAPVNVPVQTKGKRGWTLEPSGARERAQGTAWTLRALYLTNADNPWVCQCWAQVESYAVIRMIAIAR